MQSSPIETFNSSSTDICVLLYWRVLLSSFSVDCWLQNIRVNWQSLMSGFVGQPLQVMVCPMIWDHYPVCLQHWSIVAKRLDGSRYHLVRR